MTILPSLVRSLLLGSVLLPAGAVAQSTLDRSDPEVIQRELPPAPEPEPPQAPLAIPPSGPISSPPVAVADVFVGAVRVEGTTVLAPADFMPAVMPFLGRRLGRAEQSALVAAIVGVARDRGLVLATATIPPQNLAAGVLRVTLDEGRVDGVRLLGDPNPLVERMLQRLARGGPVRLAALERQLLVAGDVAGVRLRNVRMVREGGLTILQVRATEDKFGGAATLDNWGTGSIGPVEAQATLEARALATAGDELALLLAATPLDPGEFTLGGLTYMVPIATAGTTLAGSAILARTDPGGRLSRIDTLGDSFTTRLQLRHPLIRRYRGSLWGSVGAALRDVEQRQGGDLVRSDRVTSITGRLNGTLRLPAGRIAASLWLMQGVDLFGATRLGDFAASRDDADGRFTKVELRATVENRIVGPVSVALAGEAQFASGPLLSGDEMGLGGPRFGRGYDYREKSGDEGVAGSAELRWAVAERLGPLRTVQLYGFGDAGQVWNLGAGDGRGGDLFSAGAGVRAGIGRQIGVGVELGFPLDEDRDESDDRSPRISAEAFWRF